MDQANLVQKKRTQVRAGIREMGELVLDALRQSVACVESQSVDLAARIVAADPVINERRRTLEHECLVTLAAYQPAGADLRAIGACLALVSELERIGDYAADVARIVRRAGGLPFPSGPLSAVAELADTAIGMLQGALDAFDAEADADARAAVAREPQVDSQELALDEQVMAMMRADPSLAQAGTYLLWIVHNYERAADRATNVAEKVVYTVSGRVEELG